jgi:hypothetical protein
MPRRSNKWIADILTPSISLTADTSKKAHTSPHSIGNDNVDGIVQKG